MSSTTTTPEDVDAAIARAAKLGPEAAEAEAAKHPKPARKPAAKKNARTEATKSTIRAARKPAASSSARVSGRDAVAKVLADGKPRKTKEITAAAVKLVRPAMTGKTPEATLSALLYTQAKRPDGLVVRTKQPGEFKLRPVKASK